MKKVVLKLDLDDYKAKQKAMKAVSRISGIDSISIEMKDKKLTVIGDIDPVTVVKKLRKLCDTDILSVGAAKEEKKKEEPKKGEEKKKDPRVALIEYWEAYQHQAYHPDMLPYNVTSAEEDPNSCVIC